MTEQQAKIQIESIPSKIWEQLSPSDNEAIEIAIEALEKQIPKRPNKAIDSSWGTAKEVDECPACGYILTETHFINPDDKEKTTFCEVCGQKIKKGE